VLRCFVSKVGTPVINEPPTDLRELSWVTRAASSSSPSDLASHAAFPPSSYYTKRAHGPSGDPRLAALPRDLFKERRVLDIGCNEGVVTVEIGAFL
jgi:hypothetical protein